MATKGSPNADSRAAKRGVTTDPRLAGRSPMAKNSQPILVPDPPASPAEPSLLERAERLRDAILKSKLSHPDPWSYTAKARTWSQHAQQIVEHIAAGGDSEAHRREFDALEAEVESDPDFQEARRLF